MSAHAPMPIDTLKASKRLKALGFSEEQAEGLTDLLRDAEAATATKEDLDALERRMIDRFERVDERFTRVDERFTQVDKRFEAIETQLDQIDKRFDDRFQQFEATLKNYMTTRIMWAFGLLAVYITVLSYFNG